MGSDAFGVVAAVNVSARRAGGVGIDTPAVLSVNWKQRPLGLHALADVNVATVVAAAAPTARVTFSASPLPSPLLSTIVIVGDGSFVVPEITAADSLQLAAAFVAAERRPASLEVITLDDRLGAAARKEGFVLIDVLPRE